MKRFVVSAVVAGSVVLGANAFDLGDAVKGLEKAGVVKNGAKGDDSFQNAVTECQKFYNKHKIFVLDVLGEKGLRNKMDFYNQDGTSSSREYKKWEAEYKAWQKAGSELSGKSYNEVDIKKYTNKNTALNRYACKIVFDSLENKDKKAYDQFVEETRKYEKKK